MPRCRAGWHGGPGQHHGVGTGALCLDLCPASVEFARANTRDGAGLSASATYPQKLTNQAPNYTRFTHPPTAYLCSLATLEQSFQLSDEEFSAKHQSKEKRIEPGAKAAKAGSASCSPAPVLGYTACVTQPGIVSAGKSQK